MRSWKLFWGRSNRCWQWSDLGLGSGKLIVELLSIQGRQEGGGIYNRLPWITHFIQLEKIGKYCIGPEACPQHWLCVCVWGCTEGHRFQLSISHSSWLCVLISSIKGLITAPVLLSNYYFRACVCICKKKQARRKGLTKLRNTQVHKYPWKCQIFAERWDKWCHKLKPHD